MMITLGYSLNFINLKMCVSFCVYLSVISDSRIPHFLRMKVRDPII